MWDDDYRDDFDRYEEDCLHADEWEDEDEDDSSWPEADSLWPNEHGEYIL